MASQRKVKAGAVLRHFRISETRRHEKGFTIYKVIQQIIPVDKADGQIYELVVWHRYSEFKKLYQETKHLHTVLHRKEEFPSFAEAKVFGRFDESVIQDRMQSATDLLNFIGQRIYLIKSRAFEEFFKDAKKVDVSEQAKLLQPSVNNTLNDKDADGSSLLGDTSDLAANVESVWNYLKPDEEISVCSEENVVESTHSNDELINFDPCCSPDKADSSLSNFALLSQLCVEPSVPLDANCSETESAVSTSVENLDLQSVVSHSELSPTHNTPVNKDEPILTLDSIEHNEHGFTLYDTTDLSYPCVKEGVDKADLLYQNVQENIANIDPSYSSTNESVANIDLSMIGLLDNVSQMNAIKRLGKIEKGDYIYQAASQFSLAQQCEANANYHMAFNYYKSGVGILLTGVQKDESEDRREVVRRKTAKYLLKAEQLYSNYLNSTTSHDNVYDWDTGKPSPAKDLEPEVAFIQGPPSELKRYTVIGLVANRHILVVDSVSGKTYIMKVLLKSPTPSNLSNGNIIPTSCAFMVKLHRFYELDNAIYLLLEHVSGGMLWSLISGYLRTDESAWYNEVQPELTHNENKSFHSDVSNENHSDCAVEIKKDAKVLFTQDINSDKLCAHCSGNVSELSAKERPENRSIVGTENDSKRFGKRVSFDLRMSEHLTIDCESRKLKDISNDAKYETPEQTDIDSSHVTPRSPDSLSRESSCEPDKSLLSPQVGDMHDGPDFSKLLGQMHPSLDNFSICSCDSGEGVQVMLKCDVSSTIDTIHEDYEHSFDKENRSSEELVDGADKSDLYDKSAIFDSINNTTITGVPILNSSSSENESLQTDLVLDKKNVIKVKDQGILVRHTSCDSVGSDVFLDENKTSFVSTFNDNVNIANKAATDAMQLQTSPISLQNIDSFTSITNSPFKRGNILNSEATACGTGSSRLEIINNKVECDTVQQMEIFHNKVECDTVQQLLKMSRSQANLVISEPHTAANVVRPRLHRLSSAFDELDLAGGRDRTACLLPEDCVRRWAAELVSAVGYLHSLGLIICDLRPENILLTDRGHIRLTYMCHWSSVSYQLCEDARINLYVAPEVTHISRATTAADWWSVGALLYELLTGKSLAYCHPSGITSHINIFLPPQITAEAKSLLIQLLSFNPGERLGSGSLGIEEIKAHPFFASVNWRLLQS